MFTKVCLEAGCDYFRRIVLPARTYPAILVWLVFVPWNVESEQRQQCAGDLLSATALAIDDPTSSKLRSLFRQELIEARFTGLLHQVMRVP
jgi:hypothetical protein